MEDEHGRVLRIFGRRGHHPSVLKHKPERASVETHAQEALDNACRRLELIRAEEVEFGPKLRQRQKGRLADWASALPATP